MSTQNPRQLSLVELAEWYKAMLEAVQLLNLNNDIKSKLKGILMKGNLYIEELASSPIKLKSEIDQYLQEAQPFEWNRGNGERLVEDNIEKDWDQPIVRTVF